MNVETNITKDNQDDMRIVIAGHVDHGKSTVIGRLLADTGSLPLGKLDQIKEKCRRSARPFEYAFLLDALKDEQAQGITIDSARCFFRTKNRNYIIMDAPGHTEFIKNMITGASRAEAAIIVIDAAEGVMDNSKRHVLYLSLLGIEQIFIIINKMDLSEYDRERFDGIVQNYTDFLEQVGIKPISFIPVSGRNGDNIVVRSRNMPWYKGETLLETLEGLKSGEFPVDKPFRMPVQDVYKFTGGGDNRRIIAGTVEAGSIQAGDEAVFWPSGKRSRIKSIEGTKSGKAEAGWAAGFTLADQIYVHRGELAAKAGEQPPKTGNCFKATLVWLGRKPVTEGSRYLLKTGTVKVGAIIEEIIEVFDIGAVKNVSGSQINRHDLARCVITLDRDAAFDTAAENPATGRFVLVDGYDISGGGIILEAMERSTSRDSLFLSDGKVAHSERCRVLGQKGAVLWFTGLSGAGKSTIAIELERELTNRGRFAYRLDGDNIRGGLNSDLGFSIADRNENIRRITEVAKLFYDSGMITLVSFISPLRRMRERARSIIGEEHFVEIYVKASVETCIERDTKGLYAKAMEGEIKNFTGISSPYEEPDCPDLVLNTESASAADCVAQALDYLETYFQMK